MVKFIRTWWRESRVVRKFKRDRVAFFSLSIIFLFLAIFAVTWITPLTTDYVNMQERKYNEFQENKGTLKSLTAKDEKLRAEMDKLLAISKKAKTQLAGKVKAKPKAKGTKTVPPQVVKALPAPRRAVQPVIRRVKPTTSPALVAKRAKTDENLAKLLAYKKKLVLQRTKIQAQLVQLKADAVLLKSQRRKFQGQEKQLKKLRKIAVLQQQFTELQASILMVKVKLREKEPSQLNWLQRYNQDTGRAFARPVWLRANPKEREVLATIQPYILVGGDHWMKHIVLHHDRRGFLGSDRLGRDIFKRALVSVNVAFRIGLVTAFIACFLGLLLGGMAGFFGGWIDLVITWVYSIFSSIPYIVLVLLVAAIFRDLPGLYGLYIAFGLTFWIGPARVVRGEVMKIKEMEYIQAARAVGHSRLRILFRHVLPNTMHLIFVYFSLIFIGAIKSEVILTFLGLGVKGMPSWGTMISDASKEIIGGFWWQMIGASCALFLLVYAFNIFTDALQDALDPKHIE